MASLNYLDHILNGAMVLDENLNVHYFNHWLEVQTGIKRADIEGSPITDYFPDINSGMLKRKLKQVFLLNTPAFINAEAEKYLIKIPSRKLTGSLFPFMLQNAVITIYDKANRQALCMIYDQTSLFETRTNLEISAANLAEQHLLLQNTMDFQTNIIFVMSEKRLINWNYSFMELFGYDIDERINSGAADLMDFITHDSYLTTKETSFYSFITKSLESDITNRITVTDTNGKERTFIFSARRMPERENYIIVSMTDITRLKNKEKLLQDINNELSRRYDEKNIELKKLNFELTRSRDQLQLAQEVARSGSFEYFCTDGTIKVSQGMKNILGDPDFKPNSVEDIHRFFHGNHAEGIKKLCQKTMENKMDSFSVFSEIISKSGRKKPVDIYGKVLGSEREGKRLLVTMQDLTDIRELEKQIKDKERLLASLFDIADIGFLILDSEGVIMRVNREFARLTGYAEQEILGRGLDCLNIISHKSDYEKYVRNAAENTSEIILTAKDGSQKYAYMNVTRYSADEKTTYSVYAFTDITDRISILSEQKDQEQLLIQQSKMAAMGEMIGVIGHQWKQPLNVLNLVLDNIKDSIETGKGDFEEIIRMTDTSLEQVRFMAETIDDFRNFFSHDKDPRPFDLISTVNNTVRLLLPLFAVRGTQIEVENKLSAREAVYGVANEFRHCIINILSNAKDAIQNRVNVQRDFSGQVRIVIDGDDSMISVRIYDNGGGIPKDIIDHIFDPYFTTKGDKGTGIGMYMVKLIIRKMDGDIRVNNTEDGACITIDLPSIKPKRD
ncbi:PAS domain-containing sensor histidine kinase [Seleniivibrio woodruffii]|uniref:histidine kinase n=1 Tax=Seleniivibrio woodruffii TaxID=1078050 RepID=A0A4R1KCL8_9BACT|nr:PAS domain S-box protein [Seleniivibrio woodruffii]TCK61897.1 PAS domain S-box-containing protein [Seleniivibrio woodruffii]TVZ34988.1 PAS domain S-box-containing protein [Seleniivibrio woodruffii]